MGKGRSPSVTLNCEKCGREFHPWHAKPERQNRFCSRACAPLGNQPTLIDIPCEHCKVLFRPVNKDRRYCSRKCYRDAGGRTITPSGYALVYRPEHPNAAKSGQIPEHRYVMSQKISRPLRRDETVHHIDGDRLNNNPDNLELHQGRHGKGVCLVCGDCGSTNIVTRELTASAGG